MTLHNPDLFTSGSRLDSRDEVEDQKPLRDAHSSLHRGNPTAILGDEHWKLIDGFTRYMVSSHGRVWSSIRAGRFLKQTVFSHGYGTVSLMADGASRPEKHLVHRLVAQAFVPGSGEVVNHKDCDKLNNRAGNLEWCSHGENTEHARQMGRNNSHGETHYAAILTVEKVIRIRQMAASGSTHQSIADEFGIDRRNVTKIVAGKSWRRAAHV